MSTKLLKSLSRTFSLPIVAVISAARVSVEALERALRRRRLLHKFQKLERERSHAWEVKCSLDPKKKRSQNPSAKDRPR